MKLKYCRCAALLFPIRPHSKSELGFHLHTNKMDWSKNPGTGLYTLHFSHMPMAEDVPPAQASASGEPEDSDNSQESKQQQVRKMCATQLSEWYLLCRLIMEGEMGRVKGSVKVKPGVSSTGEGSSSGSRACLMPECQLMQEQDEIRLSIHFDRLDGHVVGHKTDLNNVTIRCEGSLCKGWHVGTVTVVLSNNQILKLPRRLRFLLRPVTAPRCTHCLDPVQSVGYSCVCGAVEYCSRHCQDAHHAGHSPICPTLKLFTSPKGSRVCCMFAGVEFVVYWRCVEHTAFELVVDYTNPLGRPFELLVNTLNDAREGLPYRWLGCSPQPEPSETEVNEVCMAVFHAVAAGAMEEGCIPLIAACLNHLFVYSESVDSLMSLYLHYYHSCIGEQFEGVRHISSLAEYAVFIRPMYECAQALIEWALKAPVAFFFWQRIKLAKEILINQYNFNSSVSFSPMVQSLKSVLIPDQQRQTLQLLAKVFILMATRAPRDTAQKMLRRAEECYKDSIDDDRTHNDYYHMGVTYMQLAALYLMFDDPKQQAKSEISKDSGIEALMRAKTGEAPQQQQPARRGGRGGAATAAAPAGGASVAVQTNQPAQEQQHAQRGGRGRGGQ